MLLMQLLAYANESTIPVLNTFSLRHCSLDMFTPLVRTVSKIQKFSSLLVDSFNLGFNFDG